MREIVISRPRRMECCAVSLRVEVNGKLLARLKNGQRIVMQADDGAQDIRVRGGFLAGKAFQDTVHIPAGRHSYSFQVDFVSNAATNYLPVLRPVGGDDVRDDTRVVTLLGATLSKLLLDEAIRSSLQELPGARLQLVIQQRDWRVLLHHGTACREIFHSEYSHDLEDGFAAAMVNALAHGNLAAPEGRARVCDRVLGEYICHLPEYERLGEDSIVFKG